MCVLTRYISLDFPSFSRARRPVRTSNNTWNTQTHKILLCVTSHKLLTSEQLNKTQFPVDFIPLQIKCFILYCYFYSHMILQQSVHSTGELWTYGHWLLLSLNMKLWQSQLLVYHVKHWAAVEIYSIFSYSQHIVTFLHWQRKCYFFVF